MQNMKILIADDDPVIRRLFESRLTKQGYDVTVVEDGVSAARLLDKTAFDVIITDLVMPGDVGGLELLQIAKESSVGTEVIVITAHSSIDTAVDAMKKGAVDYLEKPINFDELFLRLGKIQEVRTLVKNAGDLREAMDVTEHAASSTIQNLEITCGDLQIKMERVKDALEDINLDDKERVDKALQIIYK
ncbi:response regulator [Desulfogranum japonicum]|uniref:response regulator n=1 Tax=Desulfogranum japonicum TaxID=231447 RepID=UPI0004059D82|nr:response regulator [Desulfogranum japonicum]